MSLLCFAIGAAATRDRADSAQGELTHTALIPLLLMISLALSSSQQWTVAHFIYNIYGHCLASHGPSLILRG